MFVWYVCVYQRFFDRAIAWQFLWSSEKSLRWTYRNLAFFLQITTPRSTEYNNAPLEMFVRVGAVIWRGLSCVPTLPQKGPMREDSTPRADAHRSEPYYVFVGLEGWTNQTDRQTDKQTDRQTDKQYFPNLLGYSESSSTLRALYILFSRWPALPCHMYHNCFKCVCVCVCVCVGLQTMWAASWDVYKHHAGEAWVLRTWMALLCDKSQWSFRSWQCNILLFVHPWSKRTLAHHPLRWDSFKFLWKIKWICWLYLLFKSSLKIFNTFECRMMLQ